MAVHVVGRGPGHLCRSFSAAAAFSPSSLFGASDKGGIYDFTDKTQLFQSNLGTTAVTTQGNPVGYATELSTKGRAVIQATAANKPTFSGMPRTLGAEIASGVTPSTGTGWAWASGVGTKTAGSASNLSFALTLTVGQAYFATFRMTRTAGTVFAQLTGGTAVAGNSRNTGGSYVDVMFAVTGNTSIDFVADAAFAGTVSLVRVRPVATWVASGVQLNGLAASLQTGATVDMSAGTKLTVVACGYFDAQAVMTRAVLDVGNELGGTVGSFLAQYGTSPTGRYKGPSGEPVVNFAGGVATEDGAPYVSTFEIDPSQVTVAGAIAHRFAGVTQTNTGTGGVAAGGGNIVNGFITVGATTAASRYWKGLIHRLLIINRALTTTERANAEAWVRQGMVYAAVLGDSTSALNNSTVSLPFARRTASITPGMVTTAFTDISTSGDKIADQLTKWNAIADKSALQVVIVSPGLNDCNARAGVGGVTNATIISDFQNLITTINGSIPAGCKVIARQMTPAKGWLGTSTASAANAYAAWQDLNAAIAGLSVAPSNGAAISPITGVDARVTGHVAALSDGADGLAAQYQNGVDQVHGTTEARFIIGQYDRAALESLGLVA